MSVAGDEFGDDALAGEYVLHLLDPDARQSFERRLKDDASLRRLVRDWEASLAAFADDLPETTPPKRLRAELLDRIAAPGAARGRALRRRGLFTGVMAGLAASAAVIVTALLVLTPQQTPDAPPFVPGYRADLQSTDGTLVIAAAFRSEDATLLVFRNAGQARHGRALELWLIAEGAAVPVSLGVLPEQPETALVLSETLAALIPGGTLAVSDEPPGGSPTGAPTGEVLAAAAVAEL